MGKLLHFDIRLLILSLKKCLPDLRIVEKPKLKSLGVYSLPLGYIGRYKGSKKGTLMPSYSEILLVEECLPSNAGMSGSEANFKVACCLAEQL